jgi:UDP-N-acetylmuramate: L-alanyl-gamma-D-glutamyl-meso-diaminopimelate ligase
MSKHIHLIGICGTAMASLAGMLRAQGHRVTGSDTAAYPPMSDQLRAMGIAIMEPYSERNLDQTPDLVVVGNAISRGNPELERVLDERIPMTSMAALIHDEFLLGRERIIVCGTHGKTTTTSMLAWVYEVAALTDPKWKPSFLIGGVAENFGTSFHVQEGTKPFLLEGDEYDTAFFDKGPKFLHYFPDAAILTHVEFDHADIYTDLNAVKTAFKRMVNLIPRRGRLVAFDGSENVTECCTKAFCKVERYGFAETSNWRAIDMRPGATTHWTLLHNGEPFAKLSLPMAGEHNALNATAAAALAAGQGIPVEAIVEALATFKSVKRRLKFARRSPASPSSTTSRTIPRPSAKRCVLCAEPTLAVASSPSLSRARTPCAVASLSMNSSTHSPSPIRSSSPPSSRAKPSLPQSVSIHPT